MEKERICFNQKYIARMVLCFIVYVIIGLVIRERVLEDYGYMAQQSLVEQSMKDYLAGIVGCLAAAVFVNGIWWGLALNTNSIRQSFERNAILYAAMLGISLFVIITIVKLRQGSIIDDLGHEKSLRYAYSIGFGFLINVFGFPPQTVQDVLLPGGIWGRIVAVIIAAAITAGILI